VGGCVRDLVLGTEPNDWDIATAARPEEVMELFPDCIPTGIKHGTVTVRSDSRLVEVTTFRSDGDYADHRHPDTVSFVGDLNTDLSRRDFTMNAIAVTVDGVIIDPYRGMEDISAGIIRCVGIPEKRFDEDALRMLRAFRFSARLGFEIDPDTMQAIEENAHLTARLSSERVRDEIEKMLLTGSPEILYQVIGCGLLDPYLQKHLSRDDGLLRIAALKKRPVPRWALFSAVLLADECISDVKDFLTSLHLDGKTIRCCSVACEMLKKAPPESRTEWKTLLHRYGIDSVVCAALCWDAIYGEEFEPFLQEIIGSGECFTLKELAVNGNDLAALGLHGKQLGEMLEFLLEYVIEYPENNSRETLMALAAAGTD
jgi:tRNA nucleotidyltransferase (CCA-adding enzyme)